MQRKSCLLPRKRDNVLLTEYTNKCTKKNLKQKFWDQSWAIATNPFKAMLQTNGGNGTGFPKSIFIS